MVQNWVIFNSKLILPRQGCKIYTGTQTVALVICETPSEEFIALRLADSSEFSWDITQFSYELIFNSLRIWSQSCPDQGLSTNQLAKLQALYAYWSSPAKPSVLYHPDEPSLDILISEGKWKVLGSIVQGYRFPTSRPQACAQILSKILDNGVGDIKPVQSMAIGCAHTIIHAVHASLAKVQALMDQKTRASTPMYTSLSEWSFEKLPECLEQCQRLFRYYPGLADHE